MAITDLTNTTWNIPAGWTCSAGYGTFSLHGNINDDYFQGSVEFGKGNWNGDGFPNASNSIAYWNTDGSVSYFSSSTPLTVVITGGTDATNTKLISWLEENGTQVVDKVLELNPFLTNIANAIRTKKGSTEKINAQDFPKEIENLQTGGGLVGYSGGTISSSATFKFGLLEDGSITTTWNSNNKYVCLVIYHYASTGTYIFSSANITSKSNSSYFFIVPNANNWKALTMANDSGGVN